MSCLVSAIVLFAIVFALMWLLLDWIHHNVWHDE